MSELSVLLRARRREKGLTLRQVAALLGVTPAYVADLEADRRGPSVELLQKLSAALEIPQDALSASDSRLSPELREWIETRPELVGLLKRLRASPEGDVVIKRLLRAVTRRLSPQPERAQGYLLTWESEIRAIGSEAAAWSIETGGDLFGRWLDMPTLFLASRAGPNAKRDHAHFRLDVDYLRSLSGVLANDWSLRYFGDWHSHHRLGLSLPSRGDRQRIVSVAQKNQFPAMVEIIATIDSSPDDIVRVHPWVYDTASKNDRPFALEVQVMPGISPVRQTLLARGVLPEQELYSWEKFPLSRLRIGASNQPPTLGQVGDVDLTTREIVLSQFARELQSVSGQPVERHATGFGTILVAKLRAELFLAYALSSAWPMRVLEIHRMDRKTGSTIPLELPAEMNALDTRDLTQIFRTEQAK